MRSHRLYYTIIKHVNNKDDYQGTSSRDILSTYITLYIRFRIFTFTTLWANLADDALIFHANYLLTRQFA